MRRITQGRPGDRARSPQTERHARRKRRSHRRDVKRGGTYDPVKAPPQSARHGVRVRLLYAVIAGVATILCGASIAFSLHQPAFTSAALAILGFCSFNAMIAMVLSARREETVHQLATDKEEVPLLTEGRDGSV